MSWIWRRILEIQDKIADMDLERMKNKGPEHRGWVKGWMEALVWQWNKNMDSLVIDDRHYRVKLECGMILCENNDGIRRCKLDRIGLVPDHNPDNTRARGFCGYYKYQSSTPSARERDE